jgi:hypothetical protein
MSTVQSLATQNLANLYGSWQAPLLQRGLGLGLQYASCWEQCPHCSSFGLWTKLMVLFAM